MNEESSFTITLDQLQIGEAAIVDRFEPSEAVGLSISEDEFERRLLESGFMEGSQVVVMHKGLFGGDPLAVRLEDTMVALRVAEAKAIYVKRVVPHSPAD